MTRHWGLLGGLMLLAVAMARPAAAQAWNYFHALPEIERFHTLAIDVEIIGRLEPGDRVYVAPISGKLGGNGFYFGLQTDLHQSKAGKMTGKGLIFSRWGEVAPTDAQPAPGGWIEAQSHAQSREGDFAGVRLPYAWRAGKYTFRLETRSAAPLTGQWLDLAMDDHQQGRRVDIGSLRFPAALPARFDRRPASFVEFYGSLPRHPTQPDLVVAPDFTIRFGPPRVNGAITPDGGTIHHSRRLPSLARVTPDAGGGVTMAVGGTVRP